MSKEILVFGSIVQDLISYVERYPRPGESVRGKTFKLWCGGKGANQAVMAAKLGAKVSMVGQVGTDIFGDANINTITDAGVKSLITKTDKAATGTGCVTVTEDGENCIVVTLGANLEIPPSRAEELEKEIAASGIVMCQSEIPQETNLAVFTIAQKHGVKTFLNPAPGRADLERRLLPLTTICCVNQNEAEFITGLTIKTMDEFKNAAAKILEMGPSLAFVTLGPDGALVAEKHEDGKVTVDKVEAPKVTAVDTTGAGDCFCGSLAYFLTEHPELTAVQAAEKAVKIAAIAVSRHGVSASYPSVDELKKLEIL
ncbi:Ribokinase [Aphelenchoides besseyi]|nr:Ribokinase [Aphelenchoides besseyi]KAI6210581.1 Ribokinase [Aphelenchoides besseyi]